MRLPIIDGREVVPVRLIPFITAGSIGRQLLANILAHRQRADGFPLTPVYLRHEDSDEEEALLFGPGSRDIEIYAFHLNHDHKPVRMLSTEWDTICQEMDILEPILRKEEENFGVPDSRESIWEYRSLEILPPGVFLWREDFEALWKVHKSYHLRLPDERQDVRSINYDAFISPKYEALVTEGFGNIMAEVEEGKGSKENTKIYNTLLKIIIAMARDCYCYDSQSKKNRAVADIVEAADRMGLGVSETSVRKYLKEAESLLPSDCEKN